LSGEDSDDEADLADLARQMSASEGVSAGADAAELSSLQAVINVLQYDSIIALLLKREMALKWYI
jgi:hypothetical protein